MSITPPAEQGEKVRLHAEIRPTEAVQPTLLFFKKLPTCAVLYLAPNLKEGGNSLCMGDKDYATRYADVNEAKTTDT
jgi:hypothetical protein